VDEAENFKPFLSYWRGIIAWTSHFFELLGGKVAEIWLLTFETRLTS
jgi:hypothetical protein